MSPLKNDMSTSRDTRIEDPMRLRRRLLSLAVATGEIDLAIQIYSIPRFQRFEYWNTLIVNSGITLEMLDKVEAELGPERLKEDPISSELIEILAGNALRTGKIAFAARALDLLGIRHAYCSILRDLGYRSLGEQNYLQAAHFLIASTDLERAAGPQFAELAMRIHFLCLRDPVACPVRTTMSELRKTAVSYLLGFYPEEVPGLILDDQMAFRLMKALIEVRDPHSVEFTLRFLSAYRTLVEHAASSSDDMEESHNTLRAFQKNLLPQRPAYGSAFDTLKQLAMEHPIGVMGVCIVSMGVQNTLIPVIKNDQLVFERLLSNQEDSDAATA